MVNPPCLAFLSYPSPLIWLCDITTLPAEINSLYKTKLLLVKMKGSMGEFLVIQHYTIAQSVGERCMIKQI